MEENRVIKQKTCLLAHERVKFQSCNHPQEKYQKASHKSKIHVLLLLRCLLCDGSDTNAVLWMVIILSYQDALLASVSWYAVVIMLL